MQPEIFIVYLVSSKGRCAIFHAGKKQESSGYDQIANVRSHVLTHTHPCGQTPTQSLSHFQQLTYQYFFKVLAISCTFLYHILFFVQSLCESVVFHKISSLS